MTNKTFTHPNNNKKIAVLKTDIFVDPTSRQDNLFGLINCFFAGSGFDLHYYDIINNHFPNPKEYNAYLITGSKYSVNDPQPWITNLIDFVNNNNLNKLIGICFGHQLIAKAKGGIVRTGDWHVGIKPVTFFSSSNNIYSMRFNHQDYVLKLPKKSALIASSNQCKNSMFQIGSHTLAMQFHPEFTLEHHHKVINRINNQNGFSPMQYELFKQDIQGETNSSKALEVIKNFLLL